MNDSFDKKNIRHALITDLVQEYAKVIPDHRAFTWLENGENEAGYLSFKTLDMKAKFLANRLMNGNSVKPERALLLYPQGLDFIVAFMGCLYAGVVAVPINFLDPKRFVRNFERFQVIAKDAKADTVLSTSQVIGNVTKDSNEAFHLSKLQWIATDKIKDNQAFADNLFVPVAGKPDDLAFIQYTSGSTSKPKGIMISYKNLSDNSYLFQKAAGNTSRDCMVNWAPHFHDMGLILCILQSLFSGMHCVQMSPLAFVQNPYRWLKAISDYKATISCAPNFGFELCMTRLKEEQLSDLDLSSWEVALNGAETIYSETLQRFAQMFAPCGFQYKAFFPVWGLAEATVLITSSERMQGPVVQKVEKKALAAGRVVPVPENEPGQHIVGCGRPFPGLKVIVVNPETRRLCRPDEIGEIWAQCGGSMPEGYWGNPEANKETYGAYLADTKEGPFLRTGDFGFMLNGEFFFSSRLKDLIVIRGVNYYPQDIELFVHKSHEALRPGNGAAFSVVQDKQECLVVINELKKVSKDTINTKEIIEKIRQDLSQEFAVAVHAVILIESNTILKTSSGKIRRQACKIAYLKDELNVVDDWHSPKTGFKDQLLSEDRRPKGMTRAEIEQWIISRISKKLGLASELIESEKSFVYYGLDSIMSLEMTEDLSALLKRPVPADSVYNFPTIASLAKWLDQKDKPASIHSNQTLSVSKRADRDPNSHGPIAIVGMACRFPGANNISSYWDLLATGKDAVCEVPDTRWNIDAYYDPTGKTPGTMNTRWGGFIDDMDMFDARFFDISPEEAAAMDPQQRLFLETSWEALEHAGLINSNLAGSSTGVFAGVSMHDYDRLRNTMELSLYMGTGNTQCIIANRVSHFLGLQGPSMAIDTACSSSLVSVHLAITSLRNMECDLALAGGVNLILDPDTTAIFSQAGFLSPTGRCRTFDDQADGYIRSEGCGVVVLKRYADAVTDKDNILAVLRGSAVNQDGFSNGLTAPNGLAQQSVLQKALGNAGIHPRDISYLETHGTGTPLGDPIEANAIQAVFGEGRPKSHPLWIGSVKTNIGHTEAAAGIAGLIKVVLSLQHRQIPPHLHFEKLNPRINLDEMNGIIPQIKEPWLLNGGQRCAGISSFGFGGTNAHVIVSEVPVSDNFSNTPGDRPFHLFTLSALTKTALHESARQYKAFLETSPQTRTGDICATVNTGRRVFPYRLATGVRSNDEIKTCLEEILQGKTQPEYVQGNIPKIAFLFTGQGAQYRGMGQQLYETQPEFRKAMVQCDQVIRKELDTPVATILYKGDDFLNQAIYIQPALFALEYALARMWISWGVVPNAVMGHSIGEYVAACVSGIVSPEDGIRLVLARARLMHGLPQNGKMAAVFAPIEKVQKHLSPFSESVSVAAFNGQEHIVISGKDDKIDTLVDIFNKQDISCWLLDVSHGFHSPLMDPILDEFEAQASHISYAPAQISFVSNLTGDFSDRICDAKYWREHLRNPVRFASGVNTLHQNKFSLFLEVGPRAVLSGMAEKCLPGPDHLCLVSLKRGAPDWQQIVNTMEKLYLKGVPLNLDLPDQGYDYKRIPLPTYPFERQRYWITSPAPGPQTALTAAQLRNQTPHVLAGSRIRTPLDQIIYEAPFNHDHDLIREHRVYNSGVMSGSTYIEMLLEVLADTSGETSSFLDNIVVRAPMSLAKGESRTLQLVLDQQNEFKVFSSDPSKAAWTLHLTGQVRRNGAHTTEKYNQSVDAIRSRCSKTRDAKFLYEEIRTAGLALGPQYRWMKKIWYNDNEALVLMRQPCYQDFFNIYQIHPGLIDSCAQSLLAGADFDKDTAYMFLGYDTYRFLGLPAQPLWCHTRFKEKDKEIMSGDYDLFAEDGTLVASARGVYAKRAPAKAFFGSGPKTGDQMFHRFEWVEQPLPESHGTERADRQETWIIFADLSSQSQALLRALETEKINSIQVVPGTDYTRQNDAGFRLNPYEPEHFRRFFSEIGEWQHILYLWGVADAFTDALTKTALEKALSLCCGGLLHLVQAIGDIQSQSKGNLWCLTQNAHSVTDRRGISNPVNPVQTSLWGLARVIDNEMDNFHTHLFDLSFENDKKQINHLIDEIRQPTPERQVALCFGKRFVPRLVPAKPSAQDTPQIVIESDQAYVISGGAGGLGRKLMAWLVKMGARHLVLVGRNDLPPSLDTLIRQLTREGVDITYCKADVTQLDQIRTVLDNIPELGGIFHLAGTLDDGMLLQKDWASFEKVMAPKTVGAWNLHLLTQDRKSSFLVLFSSIASFAGIPGQADYATANAFMDGLVSYRHHKGLSGTGINWGPWADVGMAASLVDDAYWTRGGMQLISSESVFDLMKRIPQINGHSIAVVSANWKQFAENILCRPVPAMMSQLVHTRPAKPDQTSPVPEGTDVLSEIQNATDADKQNKILSYIRSQVEKTVWLDPEKQIDLDAPLMNIGFDSLKILELRNRIRQDLNTDLSLSRMIKDASILKLSRAIAEKLSLVQSEVTQLPQLVADHARKYEPFPLTDVQHAYWIGRDKSFELGNNACHVYLEADFKDIDLQRLNRALHHLIAHHDMLRAIVLPDGRQQILETVPAYDIDVTDLRKTEDSLVHSAIEEIRARMSHQMLAADQWPLFEIRATLFKDGRTRLHISFDLLIGDGGTFNILTGDLFKLYNGEQLEPISISYRDYVLAEKSLQGTDSYRQSLEYWEGRNLPSAPDLPLSLPPGQVKKPEFVRRHTRLKKSEWDSLRRQGTQAGLTPSMILLAAFAEILRYWSKSPEFTINLSLFNRLPFHPEVEKLAGDFTSLIPLAVTEKKDSTFEERALMLQQQLWNDMEHRTVSGVQVLRQMSQAQNSGAMAFPVVFTSALPYTDGEVFSLSDHISFDVAYCISQTPQVWIDHQVAEKDGELVLVWDAVEELFPKGILDDMFNTYEGLLKRLIQDPSSWEQTRFNLLPESQAVVRETIHATQVPVSDELLHALFFKQADQNPDHEALVTSEKRMTYRELALRAEQIGQCIQSHPIQNDELIAVIMEKGWEQVVAVLGILWAGAAYLPISASTPKARRDKIMENGHVKIVLTQSRYLQKFDWPEAVQCLAVDQDNPTVQRLPFQPIQKSTDLAYVIYTSGSTGDPKGVMIDHRGAVNTICDINRRFNISPQDRILGLAELSFDLSVYDIFGVLGAGATLVIPDATHAKDPDHWLKWIDTEAITLWNSVPQHMQMLIESVPQKAANLNGSLRLVLLSGDWIPIDLPEQIFAYFPNARVISLGGATEASIWSILYPVDLVEPQWKSIPYGRPMDNQQFYVLNKHMEPCPDWVTGDLYIGGNGLAKGYRLDEEKTRICFVTHPVSKIPLYKTGDQGRFLPDGTIEFQGRDDFQVKIQGYRIELGEVEASLNTCPGVKKSLVAVQGNDNNSLVGYVVPEKDSQFFESEIKQYLEQRLPAYMIPHRYMVMEQFPLSPNGKIDRKHLPIPDHTPSPDQEVSPETSVEQTVLRILCETAEIPHIGVKTNFFDAGLNSLDLVRFKSRIKEALHKEVDMVDLFKYATIRSLSRYLSRNERKKIHLSQANKIADIRNKKRRRQTARRRSVSV